MAKCVYKALKIYKKTQLSLKAQLFWIKLPQFSKISRFYWAGTHPKLP